MPEQKYMEVKSKALRKRLEEEFAEEKDIIEAQESVRNNIKNLNLKEYNFSNLHELIKKVRLIKGYTQHRLSSTIGINRSTYSRYETGERQIPNKVIEEIFDTLDLKIIIQHKKNSEINN